MTTAEREYITNVFTKSKRDGTKPIRPDLEHCHTDNVLLGVLNSSPIPGVNFCEVVTSV